MDDKRLKYIFWFTSVLLLLYMLLLGKKAGISCDEVLHYEQSVSVYNYFATHGADSSALNTPVSNLKYYGQSYDNLVTILTKWFRIDDVYGFREIMSVLSGWLAIIITALFAISLSDFKAGIIVLVLFAVSPTFLGHSENNLKDIPFALSYIAGTFFIIRFLYSSKIKYRQNLIFLILSIAFCISIRAGGLILICYLFFFSFLFVLFNFYNEGSISLKKIRNMFLVLCAIASVSWMLSIILWPFALQSPIKNVIESYKVMAHFPSTFRQIFDGHTEWSDFMPWYYLPKSMMITIPVIVIAGFVLFFIFIRKKSENLFKYSIILFTIIFPVLFVIYDRSNIYSSWRQFLFIYPAIILFSALGYYSLYNFLKSRYLKWGLVAAFIILAMHPLKFIINNPEFSYIYYNQLTGGLKGAYSNYETDYYYVSQTEASRWLINYLSDKKTDKTIVKATYSVNWQFRNNPEIKTSYFRYEDRSLSDWDYAIVANRYISPFKLRNKLWPPADALHIVYADSVPVGAVIKRKTKDDYAGYLALGEGRYIDAIEHFEKALKIDDSDEMIFYNFAAALYKTGNFQKADSLLKKGLEVNPDCELILMYLGNIARSENRTDEALRYYDQVIRSNRKYFEAYVEMAKLLILNDVIEARKLLKTCTDMNPGYTPAIKELAETYRISNPDIARKYDDLAESIK